MIEILNEWDCSVRRLWMNICVSCLDANDWPWESEETYFFSKDFMRKKRLMDARDSLEIEEKKK